MQFVSVIEKKAEGEELTTEEIQWMIRKYTDGTIPDYQMSAMCMAIRLNGMNARETTDLALAMMNSGDTVDLSDLPGIKLDKHSTGGVGDTTTLVIAPLVAACGGTVAKMSGRALGHTGGTLDKLESIPGTSIEIPMERFKEIVRENGVAVVGQTMNLVPADKKMYALRDVTGTVRSIPLIAASIMSKKLASGADVIMLDVKTGTGAFMRTKEEAFELAELMVSIGELAGRKVKAAVTDMNQPLGMAIGNALEVQEAVELLSGKIPETDPLYEVCMILGAGMLVMGGLAQDEEDARRKLKEKIDNGDGLRKLQNMIRLQGGDAACLTPEGMGKLTEVKIVREVRARESGYIHAMTAENLGNAARIIGAGRETKEEQIDPAAGIMMKVRCGMHVEAGDVLAELRCNKEDNISEAAELILDAIQIRNEKAEENPMVYGVVSA